MTYDQFIASLEGPEAPSSLTAPLLALWLDARGDWHRAHEAVQDQDDRTSAWLHAYLHRKEGDQWNADYWYRRAARQSPRVSLTEEWESIARELLSNQGFTAG